MVVGFLCSIALFLVAPHAIKAAVAAYYAPPGSTRPSIKEQLAGVAAAAAASPVTLARACSVEFNRAMYQKTLMNFDAVKPQGMDAQHWRFDGAQK